MLEVLIILAVVAGVAYYFYETQSTKDVFRTTVPPSQVIRQAVQEIGSQRRYTATGHSADYASFTFKQHANCGIAFVLACFVIVPGVLYFLLASRTQTLNVSVFPEPDGTSSVQVSASGGETKRRGKRFLRGLPGQMLPSTTPAPAQAMVPPPPNSSATLPAAAAPIGVMMEQPQVPAALPAQRSLSTGSASTDQGTTVFCQDCGGRMGADHRFCPACGKEQPAE